MSLYACVTGSRYTMTAVLYAEETVQNEDTGGISRTYTEAGRIKCYATGIAASGKDVPGTYEGFSGQGIYSSSDLIRMYTAQPIPKEYKVSYVRDIEGTLWEEDGNGYPTIFDSNGSTPIVSAGGRIIEYVSLLTRSEVQDVSIFN